jgi:DNA-binding NtrC family response regulator
LRDRGEDILLLADHFLANFGLSLNKATRRLSPAARQKLMGYHWPGNVRELRNVIERALILEKSNEIQPTSLPDFQLEARLHKSGGPKLVASGTLDEMMARYERELITALLEQNHFNLAKTSEQLKISRHALRYRMQRLNIAEPADSEPQPAGSGAKLDSP